MLKVPYFKQDTSYSCGAVALQMVFRFYGKVFSERELVVDLKIDRNSGTPHKSIVEFARIEGFKAHEDHEATMIELEDWLAKKVPVIVNFIEPSSDDGHYAVVIYADKHRVILNDPWDGEKFKMNTEDFKKRWSNSLHTSKHWLLAIYPHKMTV